jgi:outer membrane protein assembly factor BamB
VTFSCGGKELVAAANKDGRIYVLDAAAPGGAIQTPLGRSSAGVGDSAPCRRSRTSAALDGFWRPRRAVRTAAGNAANGAIVAFKLVDRGGALELQPAWVSPDLVSPVTPTFVNGVVFALSSGEARATGQRPTNAVLYALDAATGKRCGTAAPRSRRRCTRSALPSTTARCTW